MLRRKGIVVSAVLLLCVMLLTECHDDADPRQPVASKAKQAALPASKDVTAQHEGNKLDIAVSLPPEDFARLKEISGEYARSRPQLEIGLVNLEKQQAYSELRKQAELGEAPDLMLLDNMVVLSFAANGYLQPVDSLISNSESTEGLDRAAGQVKWNGYLWGIPWDLDPYVLVWSRMPSLSAGLPSKQISADWILSNQTELRKNGLETLSVSYNDPYAVMSFLSWMHVLKQENGKWILVAQDGRTNDMIQRILKGRGADIWTSLEEGASAFAIVPLSEYLQHAAEGLDFTVLSAKGDLPSGSWMKGRSFAVSTQSEQEEESGRWITAVLNRYFAAAGPNAYQYLPASQTTYNSAVFNRDPLYGKVAEAVQQAYFPSHDPQSSAKLAILNEEAAKLALGQSDFARFIDNVNTRWNSL